MPRLITSYKPERFIASHQVRQLLLTSDQCHVVALSHDYATGAAEVFDAHSGRCLSRLPIPHAGFSLKLFADPGTGGLVYLHEPEYHHYQVAQVSVGADGQLGSPTLGGLFTPDSSADQVAVTGPVAYLAFDEGVQVRNLADGTLLREIAQPLTGSYNTSAVSPDGQLAVFGDWDSHQAQVYRTSDGTLLYELQTRGVGDGDGSHMTFTPDGRQLVTARENVVQFWDAATGAPVRTVECDGIEDDTYIMTLALSADGRYMALTHTGPAQSAYDLATGEQLWLHEDLVDLHTCGFGPDSSVLLVSSGKRLVRYDTRTGEALD